MLTITNYKANMWHLKIFSIPQLFEIIETIIPTISRPILASAILSILEGETGTRNAVTAWSPPAAAALCLVGTGGGAIQKPTDRFFVRVGQMKQRNKAEGKGVPTSLSFPPQSQEDWHCRQLRTHAQSRWPSQITRKMCRCHQQ